MNLFNLKNGTRILIVSSTLVLLAGCAPPPIIEPTAEELEAARRYKKTVAVVEFGDQASSITAIQSIAQAKLENMLLGHFNLVERRRVEQVIAEMHFGVTEDTEKISKLGKLLRADYVVFGNAVSSIPAPQLRHSQYIKDGEFFGAIWEESCGESDITIKIVDVSTGLVLYSDKKSSRSCRRTSYQKFKDETLFNNVLRARSRTQAAAQIVSAFTKLDNEYSTLVSYSLEQAAKKFSYDLCNKFPHSGEILQIVSQSEVMVNLGSAYGIKPGQKLIIWEEKALIKDPKTGIVTIPKKKKATLKVTEVTSGLTCIAKSSKKVISQLRVGNKVFTH